MAESKRFLLRLDPRLFEAIRRWAEDDLRSINAQIEYLLTDQARRSGRLTHRRVPRPPSPAAEPEDGDSGVGDPDVRDPGAGDPDMPDFLADEEVRT